MADDNADVLAKVQALAASLTATQEALTDCLDVAVARRNASHRDAALPHPALRAVSEVALLLDLSRTRLLDAVKTIPAKAEYAPFAARLRDAAAAHPDIEALIRQAPRDLAAPLSDSVPVLMQIATDLQNGRDRLLEAGSGLRIVTRPAPAPPVPEAGTAVPLPTPIVIPAQLDPAAQKAIAEVAAAAPALADALRQAGALSSAVAAAPKAEDWERTLGPLREMSFVAPALEAVLDRMESLERKLSEHMAKAPPADPHGEAPLIASTLGPEVEALSASLRGVQEVAAPLVDALTDLAHLTAPLTEKLKALAPPAPDPAPAASSVRASASSPDGMAEWANDILRAVKELKSAIGHGPRGGEGERKLWEAVRRLQNEIVNLQGTLLSPPKKALPEDHHF
jgi:hypothetical protein